MSRVGATRPRRVRTTARRSRPIGILNPWHTDPGCKLVVDIDLTPTTGAGSSITLGDLSSAASNIFALFTRSGRGTANVSLTIDDRSSTTRQDPTTSTAHGTITSPEARWAGSTSPRSGRSFYLIEAVRRQHLQTFTRHSTPPRPVPDHGGAGDDRQTCSATPRPAIGTP